MGGYGRPDTLSLVLLSLSVLRIYLAVIEFDFMALPLSRRFAEAYGPKKVHQFHRFGLILGIGYFLLHAPWILLP